MRSYSKESRLAMKLYSIHAFYHYFLQHHLWRMIEACTFTIFLLLLSKFILVEIQKQNTISFYFFVLLSYIIVDFT